MPGFLVGGASSHVGNATVGYAETLPQFARVNRASGTTTYSGSVITTFPEATANNLLVAVIATRWTTWNGLAAASGWTKAVGWSTNAYSNTPEVVIFYKVSDGTETTATFVDSGGTYTGLASWFVEEWSGIATSSPLDVTATSDTGSSVLTLATGTTGTLAQAD